MAIHWLSVGSSGSFSYNDYNKYFWNGTNLDLKDKQKIEDLINKGKEDGI